MNKLQSRIGFTLMWLCTLFTAAMILVIFLFLYDNTADFFKGYPLRSFLLGSRWKPSAGEYGILPMIVGSLLTTGLSLLIAMPVGVVSVWLIHYYLPGRVRKCVEFFISIMAAVPSVVYGLFGLSILAPTVSRVFGGTGFSIVTTVWLLVLMILPTIMTLYSGEIAAIHPEYFLGALALGESKERSIVKCILPLSSYGVFSASVSALGRAVGETMAVLMVAGNVAALPQSLTEGVRTLTTNISLEMGYATGEHRAALIACGLILLCIVLFLELLIFWMKRKIVREK